MVKHTSRGATSSFKEPPSLRTWLVLGLAALAFTLLNAWKPLHIDDTAHYYYAAHIAHHPLDPYGFEVFWYQEPEPANHVLTPLLTDYWWAVAIRLFGERPWAWKIWLWPFALLFVGPLYLLLRRFARGVEMPLVIMTVLSPTFLPSFNLMLDVPALALSLGSFVVFLHACERGILSLAALAGFIAFLAIQTKYTGFLAPGIMLLYACVFGHWRHGLLAGAVTTLLFVAWECLIARLYGESHFLYHLNDNQTSLGTKLGELSFPLLAYLGGLGPALALLSLSALRGTSKRLVIMGGVFLLGYLLLAIIPSRYATLTWHLGKYSDRLRFGDALFAIFGWIVCGIVLVVLCRLCRMAGGGWRLSRWRRYRIEWFLVLWLALEIAGYYALTPFAAARRIMGIVVVATLCIGRLASRTCRSPARQAQVRGVVCGGVLLGLGFCGVDLRDAYAAKEAAEGSAELLRNQPAGTVWYVAHWGFQYYAERAGMKPVVADESRLRSGDWLVVPDARYEQQRIEINDDALELVDTLSIQDFLPWRTVRCFYGGRVPLEHQEGPRRSVRIYRVRADFIPASKNDARS
jgi:hypothetical protein